jgi:hypothetical protein
MRGSGDPTNAHRFLLLERGPLRVTVGPQEYLVELYDRGAPPVTRQLIATRVGAIPWCYHRLDCEIPWIGIERQVYEFGFDLGPRMTGWPVVQQLVRSGFARDLGPSPPDDTFTIPPRPRDSSWCRSLYDGQSPVNFDRAL